MNGKFKIYAGEEFFTANALHDKPLPVYGEGKNVRDWLYVEDHCRVIDLDTLEWPHRGGLQRGRAQ